MGTAHTCVSKPAMTAVNERQLRMNKKEFIMAIHQAVGQSLKASQHQAAER